MSINDKKKQLDYIIDFLGLKFNILQIKTWLSKNKFKKIIKKVIKVLKKKNSIIYEE